jgi:hypothetical protein
MRARVKVMVSRPMEAYRQNAPERVSARTRVRKVKETAKLVPRLTVAVLSAALRTSGG